MSSIDHLNAAAEAEAELHSLSIDIGERHRHAMWYHLLDSFDTCSQLESMMDVSDLVSSATSNAAKSVECAVGASKAAAAAAAAAGAGAVAVAAAVDAAVDASKAAASSANAVAKKVDLFVFGLKKRNACDGPAVVKCTLDLSVQLKDGPPVSFSVEHPGWADIDPCDWDCGIDPSASIQSQYIDALMIMNAIEKYALKSNMVRSSISPVDFVKLVRETLSSTAVPPRKSNAYAIFQAVFHDRADVLKQASGGKRNADGAADGDADRPSKKPKA